MNIPLLPLVNSYDIHSIYQQSSSSESGSWVKDGSVDVPHILGASYRCQGKLHPQKVVE